jgi:lipid-A-disaccharide synthase
MASPGAPLRIGIVAGEPSGDQLGARLMRALAEKSPGIRFEGICGPEMLKAGGRSLFPMERLSVLGITEIAGRIRELRGIRRKLVRHFRNDPPDAFIGVDSPGFNLGLEEALRRAGIPTLHYVSPQVWAWRPWRIRKISRAVDRVLVLFPFEVSFYEEHGVPATFVGHPLADEFDAPPDRMPYRDGLGIERNLPTVALLPGSRASEMRAHAELFICAALWVQERVPNVQFVIPFVNRQSRDLFEQAIKRTEAWELPLKRVLGHSRDVMAASDVVLVASGTATLEAALLGRPQVVTYRVSGLTHFLISRLSKVRHYAMPNLLAGRELVPELLQGDATPEKLGTAVERFVRYPGQSVSVLRGYEDIRKKLRGGGVQRAAEAVLEVVTANN